MWCLVTLLWLGSGGAGSALSVWVGGGPPVAGTALCRSMSGRIGLQGREADSKAREEGTGWSAQVRVMWRRGAVTRSEFMGISMVSSQLLSQELSQ